jgi:cytoskeletal protein RodZ
MENVNLKRKVTLKRKGESSDKALGKPNKLIWFAILGVVAVVAFFGIKQFGDNAGNDLPADVKTPTETLVQQDIEIESISDENEPTASDSESEEGSEQSVVSEGASSPVDVVADKSNTTTSNKDSKTTVPESASSKNTSNSGNQSTSVTVAGSVDEKARRTIRGDFGNGAERKNALGSEYDAIQAKVNEIYRNGLKN